MRRDIRELQQKLNLTTIFVTHDQEEANTIADRMAVLDQGIIQQVGAPVDLYDKPANLFVANFLGTANVLKGVISESGGEAVFRSEGNIEFALDSGERGRRLILFRPQNVNIVVEGATVDETRARLTGVIRHTEFLGSILRYAVDVFRDIGVRRRSGIPFRRQHRIRPR